MASYTMELKTYIESFSQYDDELTFNQRLDKGREKLFDFDYPIFDNDYKVIFETNLIRKFYNREIGFETEGLFKFNLETWLNINMPYFNKLFESELLEYDPLINSEMNVTHTQTNREDQEDDRTLDQDVKATNKSTGKGTSSHNTKEDMSGGANENMKSDTKDDNFSRKVTSDTPDTRLALQTQEGKGIIQYASNIEEDKVTNSGTHNNTKSSNKHHTVSDKGSSKSDHEVNDVADSTSISKDKRESNINKLEDFVQHRQGKIGVQSYPEMVTKYRNSFLRVENIIHKELQQLFMLVY